MWTSLVLLFIKYVLRIPLRMTDTACKIGDYAVHAEESYTFAYYNRALLARRDVVHGQDVEHGLGKMIMGRAISEDPHHADANSSDAAAADSIKAGNFHSPATGAESKKEA